MKRALGAIAIALSWLAASGSVAPVHAQAEAAPAQGEAAAGDAGGSAVAPSQAKSLEELLKEVQQGWRSERSQNRQREAAFSKARAEQKTVLEGARRTLRVEEQRSEDLEQRFEDNELRIADLEETLRERLGTLGELFGVVRQVAGDTLGNIDSSLVSVQIPGRGEFLETLGASRSLPSIDSLERLWFILHQEMTESGRVVRFPAKVVAMSGAEEERRVVRVGAFNALSNGNYLRLFEGGRLAELARQPAGRALSTVAAFEAAAPGALTTLAVDPSRGAILALLVQEKTAAERIQEGGEIGYTIIGLGLLAGLVGLWRWLAVFMTSRKVTAQQRAPSANPSNPLGRVMTVYDENKDADTETLELKLDEAILRETSQLDRFLWAIKVVSVVAPLMGLLGTVTGMIATFQSITLFGTGDPKMMAGGISEALVTTMLGLYVAIPLVLLHALVQSGSKRVTDVLEEQSAGLVARQAEISGV